MCEKIQSKKLKKNSFTAELVKVCSTILVNSIEIGNDDEEIIKMYFESKKSGGGTVESVCLLGNAKATVTFQDHRGNALCCITVLVV